MRGALAVAVAELRANRLAVGAGLALGLTLLAIDLVWGVNDIAPFVAAAVNMSLAIALGLGASIVSRDLAERRLGFYLTRPLPSLAYYCGKMSAALLLALAAGAACLLPALLLGRSGLSWTWVAGAATRSWGPYLAVGFLLSVGAAAGGAARTRSRLLLLDVVLLPLTFGLFLAAIGDTWRAGTVDVVLPKALPVGVVLATLALLCASAAQVALGRLDLGRGHAWLSAIGWSGLLAFVAGVGLYSRGVADATPSDLQLPTGVALHAPRSGSHVMLDGVSRRHRAGRSTPLGSETFYPGFLLDERADFVRLGGLVGLTGFAWSADGRHFAWSRDSLFGSGNYSGPPLLREIPGFRPSLWVSSFDGSAGRPRRLPRDEDAVETVRAVSASGRRLLLARTSGKLLLDVESGATLARLAEAAEWSFPRFLSESALRALRIGAAGHARVVEWDSAGGRLTERGEVALEGGRAWFSSLVPTDDFEHVLRFDASGLHVHDLDGRVSATLLGAWPERGNRAAGLVSGGRVASLEEQPDGLRLRVFDLQGRRSSESLLPGRFPVRVGGESAPGVLALGVAPADPGARRETLFVDLARGGVLRREAGLQPALRRWTAPASLAPRSGMRGDAALFEESANPEPGSLGTRLFLADEGVVLLDSSGGGRRVVVRRTDRRED